MAFCLAAAPAAADARPAVPTWQGLENLSAHGRDMPGAQARLADAVPPGTSTAQAIAWLTGAGASCKPRRRFSEVERCLIHQYSLADGAADDVRWTIMVRSDSGAVSSIAVDRYVDRHGSA